MDTVTSPQHMKLIFLIHQEIKATPIHSRREPHTSSDIIGFVKTKKEAKKWEEKPVKKETSTLNTFETRYHYTTLKLMEESPD